MKKIKTVFAIDRTTNRVTTEVVAHWVIAGEGVATIKWDGTSCAVIGGALFKRYDAKPGRTPPAGFTPCEPAPDANTGHWPGWVPVSDSDPADRAHREAFAAGAFADGTYELLGPKVQKNPYGLARHELRLHGAAAVDVPRTFEGIREWLVHNEGEGLVFHHEDGRMAKIRRKDFGISWNR